MHLWWPASAWPKASRKDYQQPGADCPGSWRGLRLPSRRKDHALCRDGHEGCCCHASSGKEAGPQRQRQRGCPGPAGDGRAGESPRTPLEVNLFHRTEERVERLPKCCASSAQTMSWGKALMRQYPASIIPGLWLLAAESTMLMWSSFPLKMETAARLWLRWERR